MLNPVSAEGTTVCVAWDGLNVGGCEVRNR